jgi:hypothetical protein
MFKLLWEQFWGRRDSIRKHMSVHPLPSSSAESLPASDLYNLSEPCPQALRTLSLSQLPIFKLAGHESTKILIRDEFITVYKLLVTVFENLCAGSINGYGIVVTGQPGIGEKPIYLVVHFLWDRH